MFKTREQIERDEACLLAPYAQKSAESEGRKHPEEEHGYRTCYQRDRARIIHSGAFRRLDGKTQVFLNGSGDYYRTRLTHTMEVASISRTIARTLSLNEDLAETIALAHDLGHAPFGHAGEGELDTLMKMHGGFEHNTQSLRVVELLESKYPDFAGLNLSYEVLEGLRKHQAFYQPPSKDRQEIYYCPTLEAQIANLADEITYYSHDLDDGLQSGLLHADQLMELEIWSDVRKSIKKGKRAMTAAEQHRFVIRCIVNREVDDLVRASAAAIGKSGVRTVDEARRQKRPLIRYSEDLLRQNRQLRKFLYRNFYHHPEVAAVNESACELLHDMFRYLMANPSRIGPKALSRAKQMGLERTIADFLSGMTDRYLIQMHEKWIKGRARRKS